MYTHRVTRLKYKHATHMICLKPSQTIFFPDNSASKDGSFFDTHSRHIIGMRSSLRMNWAMRWDEGKKVNEKKGSESNTGKKWMFNLV